MNRYKEILSIEVNHEYYADGKCKFLNIVPDPATQQWFSKHDMQLKSKGNGVWALYVHDMIDVEEIKDYTSADFRLRFNCLSNHVDFNLFTDIPLEANLCLVYSKNAKDEEATEFVAKKESIRMPAKELVACIDISLNDFDTAAYTMQFKARAVPVEYYIMSSVQVGTQTLELEGAQAHLFTGPESVKLPNGSPAQVFDSGQNVFKFKEREQVPILNLRISTGDGARGLSISLPSADFRSLKLHGQELYVPIFVYT